MEHHKLVLFRLLSCISIASLVHGVESSKGYNITVREKQMLDDLCPEVDICDQNEKSAVLTPNGLIRRGFVSCCKGCSCHPGCEDELNCCYPGNHNGGDDVIEPKQECVYTRIGQLEEEVPVTVPAYQTIVHAPQSGCVENKSMTVGSNQVLYPTCKDEYFAPLNAYFPVYSPNMDQIYKNLLCARCHGATDSTPFVPKLACRGSREFPVSMSEQLYFLETGLFTTQCFMDFSYEEPSIISSKQCYRNVVEICESNDIKIPPAMNVTNVDIGMVRSLCEMGVYSPMVLEQKVYKNAFCALCGHTSFKDLLCVQDPSQRTEDDTLVNLLHAPQLLKQVVNTPETHPHPEVCITDENIEASDRCKKLHCSSGKIRNTNGDCVFITKSWSSSTVLVQMKLIPRERSKYIRNMIQGSHVPDLVAAIMKEQPWSENWSVMQVMRRGDDSDCSEKSDLAIFMETETNNLEKIHHDIKTAIDKNWAINMKGLDVHLYQTFHDYTLLSSDQRTIMVPQWQLETHNSTISHLYNDCKNISWETVFASKSFRSRPVQINKLILCLQITLFPGEFTLGDHGTYLQSKFTQRTLFKFEFDLIQMKDYHARVCLADTIFSIKQRSIGLRMVSENILIAMLFTTLSFDLL